ncbi:uncharacterized protein ACA1_377240 [Acanthamoeba castellanii str. Neff]|uniref:Uncharacterized protein n=1 Tax=Acanthamoeba castellanii (strain ATCC 30010 / Neff) TaxID=1257118 RepID=L8GRN8_ACACF|nr:uncharacterized protein ACA1_377240 [Acanthamoeba castellanii str. Neff]ELR15620.1 hypothetical protein ACA1_377240 [Acanthamoeba castellanii str. Neff]
MAYKKPSLIKRWNLKTHLLLKCINGVMSSISLSLLPPAPSVLDYTPLCATPLHACFHLDFSYHIMVASAQLNESKTNIITNCGTSTHLIQYLNFFSTFTPLLHLNLHSISS